MNSIYQRSPSYSQAIKNYLNGESQKLNLYLKNCTDYSLKKLIQVRIHFRDKKYSQAQVLLESVQSGDPFIRAEKHFLMGNLNSYLNRWEKALSCNLQAYEVYSHLSDTQGVFQSSYNLSVDFSRMGLHQVAEDYLKIALKHSQSPENNIAILRAMSCQASEQGRFPEAKLRIQEALRLCDQVSIIEQNTLKIVAVDIFVRCGDLNLAYELLHSIQFIKQTNLNSRLLAHKHMLNILLSENPIEAELPELPDRLKENDQYLLQWKIILFLQRYDTPSAQTLWKELVRLWPKVYHPNFKMMTQSSERSLFFRTLQKLLMASQLNATSQDNPFRPSSLPGRMYTLLSQSEKPIYKNDLIEALWKQPYHKSLDPRFYKLVERFKKAHPYGLQQRKQHYFLLVHSKDTNKPPSS